jgi:hypothetical protein
MGEQAGVIGLRRRRRVNPEAVGEPARDQRAVQPVLERKAHPEVGGQAERADHLRGTNSLTLRCFGRHCLTVTESAKATTSSCRTMKPA